MTNWLQMAQSYAQVLRAATTAIKSAAPNLKVIGPDWSDPQDYAGITASLNQLGATALLSAFTFHDYDDGGAPRTRQLHFTERDR